MHARQKIWRGDFDGRGHTVPWLFSIDTLEGGCEDTAAVVTGQKK